MVSRNTTWTLASSGWRVPGEILDANQALGKVRSFLSGFELAASAGQQATSEPNAATRIPSPPSQPGTKSRAAAGVRPGTSAPFDPALLFSRLAFKGPDTSKPPLPSTYSAVDRPTDRPPSERARAARRLQSVPPPQTGLPEKRKEAPLRK